MTGRAYGAPRRPSRPARHRPPLPAPRSKPPGRSLSARSPACPPLRPVSAASKPTSATANCGLRATDAFLASTLSKHLLRETRLADAAVNNPDALRFNTSQRRYGLPGSVKADPDDAPEEDEDVEAEKIRVLEERMALFEKGVAASSSAPRASKSSTISRWPDSEAALSAEP